MILDGGDHYQSGYNQGIRDSIKYVSKIPALKLIAYQNKYLDSMVIEQLELLERK